MTGIATRPSTKHCLTCRRGVALVEFALVLGLLVLFLASIIEMGNFWLNYRAATNCVADASRYLAKMIDPNTGASNEAIAYAGTIATCQAPPDAPAGSAPMNGLSLIAAQVVYQTGPALRYGDTTAFAVIQANYTYQGLGLLGVLFPGGSISVNIAHSERGGTGS